MNPKRFLLVVFAFFLIMATLSSAACATESVQSQMNIDRAKIENAETTLQLDKVSILKKRFLLKYSQQLIKSQSIGELAYLLAYQNDYLLYALCSIENVWPVPKSYLPALRAYHQGQLDLHLYSSFNNNVYSDFACSYLPLFHNVNHMCKVLDPTFFRHLGTEEAIVSATPGALLSEAALAAAVGLGGSAAAGGTATASAFSGTMYSLGAVTAGTSLLAPVILVVGVGIGGAAATYEGYKYYKILKSIPSVAHKKHFQPIINKCMTYYGTPINHYWDEAIRDYLMILKERQQSLKLRNAIYQMLANDSSVSPTKVMEFREKIEANDVKYNIYDTELRGYLFDEPLDSFMSIINVKLKFAEGYIFNNKKAIMNAGIDFSRMARIYDYTAFQSTRNEYTDLTKCFKKDLSKNEYKELKARAQLATGWLPKPRIIKVN